MSIDLEKWRTGASWVGGSLGVGVPGYAFFTSYPPPLFPMMSLISAVPAAILLIELARRPRTEQQTDELPRDVKKAAFLIGAGLLLLVLYGLLFNFTTITASSDKHLQIGFGRANWSLTDAGKNWVQAQPSITVLEMVKNEAAFDQDRLAILWTTWSIYSAGGSLILLYFSGFILWTIGFAILAKRDTHPDKA